MTYVFLPHASRLCRNLGGTYTFHCRRKSKWASKWLGFLVNVWFWPALTLTLNQRGPEFESPVVHQNSFNSWVKTTLGRAGSLTLRQLCQNYMSPCFIIGKMEQDNSE